MWIGPDGFNDIKSQSKRQTLCYQMTDKYSYSHYLYDLHLIGERRTTKYLLTVSHKKILCAY